MNFFPVPSLQSMSATKIATIMWNREEIIALIAEYSIHNDEGWQEIELKVVENLSLLPLPATVKEEASNIVRPLGDQIRLWKTMHIKNFYFKNVFKEYHWTSRGTLDKRKTAEAFVQDLTFSERDRYIMASLYCIEAPVPCHPLPESSVLDNFSIYWTYNVTGDKSVLDKVFERLSFKTPYQRIFESAIEYVNEVAAMYYFQKLTPTEKEDSLCDVPYHLIACDFGFFSFLLSQMNDWEQSELFQKNAVFMLSTLLKWPYQCLFVEMADRARDLLREYQFYSLLTGIVDKIKLGYKDYDYGELFRRLWMLIPETYRKTITAKCTDSYLLWDLFQVKDKSNILLILSGATKEEKEQILLSQRGVCICSRLARDNEQDWLEFFIGECVTSCDKLIQFKRVCNKKGPAYFNNYKYFEFLDKLIERYNKKGDTEEVDCPAAKRLCSSSDASKSQV